MEITEVRIKLMNDPNERLLGFCSITLDASFVIRDLKIISGGKGSFVAMPSRRLMDRCSRCHNKNHLRARYCNQCGEVLREDRSNKDPDGRAKLYADIAHPINSDCREQIQAKVMEAYDRELVEAKQPGYICRYDDYGEDDYDDEPISTLPHRDVVHRIDPAARTDSNQTQPHVLKLPQTEASKANTVRFSRDEDGDFFGSGII